MNSFEIAIIDANVLSCMGLRRLLEEIIPSVKIAEFHSYEEMAMSDNRHFMHFFVASAIYFEHAQFFMSQPHRSIVLVHGDAYPHLSGLLTLNVCQDEQHLVKSLLQLRRMGHQHIIEHDKSASLLSSREIEVAVLLARGYINKEIADFLHISVTTVITHRKNIMEKLQARSLADIIIYVVMNGLADVNEL